MGLNHIPETCDMQLLKQINDSAQCLQIVTKIVNRWQNLVLKKRRLWCEHYSWGNIRWQKQGNMWYHFLVSNTDWNTTLKVISRWKFLCSKHLLYALNRHCSI